MATASCGVDVKFVSDEDIQESSTPLRAGLRSQSKKRSYHNHTDNVTSDDRRFRYSEQVTFESSSDDDDVLVPFVGEAVLSKTPISSHDVFSFKKPKRKSALTEAASEAIHVRTHENAGQENTKSGRCERESSCLLNGKISKSGQKPNKSVKGRIGRNRDAANNKDSSEDSSSCDSDASIDEETRRSKMEAVARMMNSASDINNNLEDMLDEYFLAHDEKNCVTSDRTLSQLSTPRMDQETLSAVLRSTVGSHHEERRKLFAEYKTYFEKWAFQLRNGFNLLLHGLGSKRCIIDHFRTTMLSKFTQLVVNGYFPSMTIKNILNTITIEILEHDGTFKNLNDQCNFIRDYYNANKHERLYLIVHNIDGTMLRSNTAQTILSLLAQSPSIYLIASIDHIHAPLIWDQTQSGRFNWLWYDVTTFEPYTEETSYENSLLVQQSGSLALSSLIHVFRSLTANAKGVFMLIANYQLEHTKETNYNGLSFHDCYTKSREAFLVNSDATLRAQLTEFRDHKLVRSKKGADGVEYLLIPLDESTLKQFLDDQGNN